MFLNPFCMRKIVPLSVFTKLFLFYVNFTFYEIWDACSSEILFITSSGIVYSTINYGMADIPHEWKICKNCGLSGWNMLFQTCYKLYILQQDFRYPKKSVTVDKDLQKCSKFGNVKCEARNKSISSLYRGYKYVTIVTKQRYFSYVPR